MLRALQYRIYPTHAQRRALDEMLEECRWVYNETLATRKQAWEEQGQTLRYYDTAKLLPLWKMERPALRQVNAQVLQNVMVRVDLAFAGFFRRVKTVKTVKTGEKPGYPRFKGKGRYDSLTYPQARHTFWITPDGKLRVSKVGHLRIKLHRPVEGTLKTLTLRRGPTGKWYATLAVVCDRPAPLPPAEQVAGIDVGLTHFATLSTGEHIPNPRFFRQDERALAKAQRKLSQAEQGKRLRAKCRKVVSRIHERIANRRKDFAHKLSRRLVDEFGILALEDLDIPDLLGGSHPGLNKSIADAAWGQLREYTTYKAEEAGRRVIMVDPRNTTKRCSVCGLIVEKTLADRVHHCPRCGLTMDRDLNAALNILRVGLHSLGASP